MGDNDKSSSNRPTRSQGAWPWSLLLAFALVWGGFAVVGFSHILIDMVWFAILALSGGLIAMVWFVMTLLEIIARFRAHPEILEMPYRRIIAWIMVPVIGFVGVVLALTDLDLRARVAMSHAALENHAQEIRDSGSTEFVPVHKRVGLFYVWDARANTDGTVQFILQHPWIFTETGLIHDPNQITTHDAATGMETDRLGDTWVVYVWSD